eukprot:m.22385 g.22385  ORF g.22385 m.22385 type:complete len:181 (-) comp11244_c0_seq1:905-1447(-)
MPTQVCSLGELVQIAWHKNRSMIESQERSLPKTLFQRTLWARLQGTFFAPDADADALSVSPALTPDELAFVLPLQNLEQTTRCSKTTTKTSTKDLPRPGRPRRRSISFTPTLNGLDEHLQDFDIEAQLPSLNRVANLSPAKMAVANCMDYRCCQRVEMVNPRASHPLQQRCELLRPINCT